MTSAVKKWPVFILGTQRSGTTLLTRALSAHPKIFIQNELELPNVFDGKTAPADIIDNIKKEVTDEHKIDIEQYITDDSCIWGLKDPQLTEHIKVLKNFLPHSKFIIIVRDARGVTNSYMENKWGLGTNAYTGALRWNHEVNQQLAFMETAPDNFLLIRYEDMIADLEAIMHKVCTHLEISFDEQMMSYNNSASYYTINRENIHTFKKPDPKLAEKWMKKLSKHQINVVEHITHPLLTRLNYSLIGTKISISFLEKLYYTIHQAIIGEIQIQYRWRKFRFKEKLKMRNK